MSHASVKITAVSWHDSILPRPLRFAPPYADRSTNPMGFSRFWQFANYAFDLPDPRAFPTFAQEIDPDDRRVLERFIQSARELAAYSVMSASDSVVFKAENGGETYTATFSPSESIRGTATLFRQLYAKSDDHGNYQNVVGLVSRLHRADRGPNHDLRQDILAPWRRAHGRLLQQRIEAIVGRMAANDYAGTPDSAPVPFENLRPTEMISKYFYGDLVHRNLSRRMRPVGVRRRVGSRRLGAG